MGQLGNYCLAEWLKEYNRDLRPEEKIGTNALHPLHLHPHGEKMPETYPFGLLRIHYPEIFVRHDFYFPSGASPDARGRMIIYLTIIPYPERNERPN